MKSTGLPETGPPQYFWFVARLVEALRPAAPAVLFGLRLWAAACLALYVAYWLQLDNPSWAGTSAAIMCQPSLGASLRKGWFRMIGTVIGAIMIVILTAVFVQSRVGYLLGLALWCAASGFAATLLRNFAAYSAALAGYTAVIIASDELGATGGAQGDAFMLAVSRASEICIGIICAGVVLASTDFGGARRRLAAQFAAVASEISARLAGTLLLRRREQAGTRPTRRDLLRRVIALDPIIDEAVGEVSDLRYHTPVLQAGVGGLFAALSAWRIVAVHLELTAGSRGRREAELVHRHIPPELRSWPAPAAAWTDDPDRLHRACDAAVRGLAAIPSRTPSLQLLADRTAQALIGVQRALNALVMLANPERHVQSSGPVWYGTPDLLPATVNAGRIFITIGALELFWIATAWPSGASSLIFAAIGLLLFSPLGDRAYVTVRGFMIGVALTTVWAAIVKFAVLPGVETFAGFSLAMALVLVPAGALMAQPWQTSVFTAMTVIFIPLLSPTNQMTFDTQQFYNSALAIFAGIGAAALSFRLVPMPSPALRARRLLAHTLRDLRRLTAGPISRTPNRWQSRIFSRLAQMPEQSEPLQRAQLVAALAVGSSIIRLRRVANRFGLDAELDWALDAVAQGDCEAAMERLTGLDRRLAQLSGPGQRVRMRARARILAISEALEQHADYFGEGAAR